MSCRWRFRSRCSTRRSRRVTLFLLAATPLLVIGVGLAVWILVGRALRAVEDIRAEVATIDDQGLSRRVAVPATHDEIAALAETMNTMLDRLETSHHAQRSFVSDASHELRSPLATLTTAAELAAAGDEPTRTRLLGTISSELVRVRRLVDSLMTLARADAHDLLTVREDVDLDDLVDAEVQRLRATSVHRITVHLEPVRLTGGDPQRLAQALRNLVDNAERHAVGSIRLSLRRTDGHATLDVDNDGPVVPTEDRDRIFERFVRLDESRSRDAGGSGLGLAIARTAIESHGGTLRVVDAPDGWCRFEIMIPASRSEIAPHDAEVEPAVTGPFDRITRPEQASGGRSTCPRAGSCPGVRRRRRSLAKAAGEVARQEPTAVDQPARHLDRDRLRCQQPDQHEP